MDWRIAKLIESIDSHTGRVDWSLERACRELGLDISPAYAAQLFRRYTGLGVREYAKKRRLQQAMQRLTTTEIQIKVIADQLGYKQASDFTRFVREQHHVNPMKLRKGARLGNVWIWASV